MRIFRYLRPYRAHFALMLVLLFITSSLSLVFPFLLGKLLDAQPGQDFWSAPLLDLGNIDSIAKLLAVVFALQALFGFGRIQLSGYIAEHALARVRIETYRHLLQLPMDFFARRRVGELNSRITADVALLQDLFTTVTAELLRQVIVIGVSVLMLARLSPPLLLTMLAIIPVVALVAVLFGRYIQKLGKRVQDRIADTGTIVDETLQGILNVKAFANEAWEAVRYQRSVEDARALALKGVRWRAAFVSFIILCMFGAIVVVVWRAVHLRAEGLLSSGDITSFVMYTVFIGAGFASIPELIATVLKAIGATERLMDIQDEAPEPLSLDAPAVPLPLKGGLAFEHVGFHYATRPDMPVLQDVSFRVKPGERVALVGPSGAGKTTIASLVLRLYDPVAGEVLFDGRPASSLPLTALRDRMAIVPQEVLLFGGSIRENIAYGKPGASQEEVEAAARKANAHDFIVSFPEGYTTVVGERGIQLSGGQRQRIAIARAVLKDPAILILDEATSALDSASEKLVQDALENLMRGRTSIVIAHRLSTVRHADRILVIDKGRVAESGTHDELIADRRYWRSVFQFEPDAARAHLTALVASKPVPPRPSWC
ncbi:MAG: ATP-binding cassette domain-containing protein [Flavobacteriales bacterium]|nr:ATP-binding cassette domain-containing protein [Flavobacteriales bacterium]